MPLGFFFDHSRHNPKLKHASLGDAPLQKISHLLAISTRIRPPSLSALEHDSRAAQGPYAAASGKGAFRCQTAGEGRHRDGPISCYLKLSVSVFLLVYVFYIRPLKFLSSEPFLPCEFCAFLPRNGNFPSTSFTSNTAEALGSLV